VSYIEQYKTYRQALVQLHMKILNTYVHEAEFKQAAGIIGILNNRNQVVIETEADQDGSYAAIGLVAV